MVRAEFRDVSFHEVGDVVLFEGLKERPDRRGFSLRLFGFPDRRRVPDPAEFQTEHGENVFQVMGADVFLRPLQAAFLVVEEDEPDLQIGWRRPPESGRCVQDRADARGVVVRAGTARDGVMVGGDDEGLRAAAEVEEEIRPFVRPGRVRGGLVTLDFVADAQAPEDRFEGLPSLAAGFPLQQM
ncbi:MAG: hypothetical protein QGG90_04045, partial [Nitrospinota bacterium]|nr:hypothetical protein [Nitrospinota bacterium]